MPQCFINLFTVIILITKTFVLEQIGSNSRSVLNRYSFNNIAAVPFTFLFRKFHTNQNNANKPFRLICLVSYIFSSGFKAMQQSATRPTLLVL